MPGLSSVGVQAPVQGVVSGGEGQAEIQPREEGGEEPPWERPHRTVA